MRKILIIFICVCSLVYAQENNVWNDGPYVTLTSDSTFLIQYIDADSLIRYELQGGDSLTFKGRGFDSDNSYTVYRNHLIPKEKYSHVPELFVFSDIHGEYEYLIELLVNNNIVDTNLTWTFGEGHLVIDGDIFDRGDKVNEILWMVYRLEKEAEQAGGMVHYLLGNHEIMPLQNDLRYIHKNYSKVSCSLMENSYSELYGSETVLGDWLRSKNICEVINGMLFVHGGLNPDIVSRDFSIEYINNMMRDNIDLPRDTIKADSVLKYLFGGLGPTWYRGYHYEMENRYSKATEDEIDDLLNYYDVDHIIVGHTVKDSVSSLYNGKIFAVNQDYTEHSEIEGMYWSEGIFYACDIFGNKRKLFEKK